MKEERVLLIIADISGYTQYMISNTETIVHSQIVISELIEEIIRQVEIPLEVEEVEGDAVFLYAVKHGDDAAWDAVRSSIGEKLMQFFDLFTKRVTELSLSSLCACDVCKNIDQLKLKVIVHSGTAVIQKINRFTKVVGVDTIIVHRLLKNSVPFREYILMTDEGYKDIRFPEAVTVTDHEEQYPDVGTIKAKIFVPPSVNEQSKFATKEQFTALPFGRKMTAAARWNSVMYQKAVNTRSPIYRRTMNNIDLSSAQRRRPVYSMLLLLWTPFYFLFNVTRHCYRILRFGTVYRNDK